METIGTTIRRFYSPVQIGFAAFIGSPVAACWCFAQNYKQLGKPETAMKWLVWGGGGSLVALAFLCLVPFPKNFLHYVIPVGYSIGLREAANRIHGDIIKQQISFGGRLASWWFVIGISSLFLVGVFGIMFIGFYFLKN